MHAVVLRRRKAVPCIALLPHILVRIATKAGEKCWLVQFKMYRRNELLAQMRVYILMLRLPLVCALTLLVSSNWIGANAAEIHKWVDDKGLTHYSDAVPLTPATSVTRLEINTGNITRNAKSTTSENYYSIANQWQRLQQERLQQQQFELQKASTQVDRSATPERVVVSDESHTTRYLVAYPTRIHRRHAYPKYHGRPRRSHGNAHQPRRGHVRSTGYRPVN